MASLATARTRLGLGGTPSAPPGSFLARVTPTNIPVTDTWSVSVSETTSLSAIDARTGYTQNFSRLGLNAVSRRNLGAFAPKTTVTQQDFAVTDTWLLTVTELPVDSNEIVAVDDYRLTFTETAGLFNNLAVTDTLSLSVVETISLLQSGVLTINVTDTWSLTWTEGAADIRVQVPVTDTLSMTWTETAPATVDTPLELKTATDTWSVTWTDNGTLQIFAGVVPINVFDTYSLRFDEAIEASLVEPVRYIRFTAKIPNIRFRVL